MVLQKVGETATEIQVNGTTEGNFTQVNDSVYDVSVSGSLSGSTTVSHSISCGQDESASGGGSIPPAFMIVNSEVTISAYADFNSNSPASIAGTSVSEFDSNSTSTKTVQISGGESYDLNVNTENAGGANANASISYNVYTNIDTTVNSVNKQ